MSTIYVIKNELKTLARSLPIETLTPVTLQELQDGQAPFAFTVREMSNKTNKPMLDTLKDLPDLVLSGLQNGRMGLILDNSGEANYLPDHVLDNWYSCFDELKIAAALVTYVSQDVMLPTLHDAYIIRRHWHGEIHIGFHHLFMKRLSDSYSHISNDLQEYEEREQYMLDDLPKAKRALCLINKPRARRIQLALSLLKEGVWDDIAVSFSGFEEEDRRAAAYSAKHDVIPTSSVGEFRKLQGAFILEPYLPILREHGVVSLDIPTNHSPNDTNPPPNFVLGLAEDLYVTSRFSIVSETEMANRMYRFTEKSIKPFACYHPAVFFGNPFSLRLLRFLDFETFGNIIDESYDEEVCPSRRFDAAFIQAMRIVKMSDAEWHEQFSTIRETLIHNAHHFFFELPRIIREQIDVPLIRLLKGVQMQAVGGRSALV